MSVSLASLTSPPRYGGSFKYGNWLSVTLPTVDIWKYRDAGEYAISIFTSSDMENAAFDGDVYVKLTGSYGTTEELMLCNETTVSHRDHTQKSLIHCLSWDRII